MSETPRQRINRIIKKMTEEFRQHEELILGPNRIVAVPSAAPKAEEVLVTPQEKLDLEHFEQFINNNDRVISPWEADAAELTENLGSSSQKKPSSMTDAEYEAYLERTQKKMKDISTPMGGMFPFAIDFGNLAAASNSKKTPPDPSGDWKEYNDYLKASNEKLQRAVDKLVTSGLPKQVPPSQQDDELPKPQYGVGDSLYSSGYGYGLFGDDDGDGSASQQGLDEWRRRVMGYGDESVAGAPCGHDWKLYQGLMHDDYYCTKCGVTKPIGPKE